MQQARTHHFSFLPSEGQASASVTPCVSWQRCWGIWSLALWSVLLKPSLSCWHPLCWCVVDWWDCGSRIQGPMSSCRNSTALLSLHVSPIHFCVAWGIFFHFEKLYQKQEEIIGKNRIMVMKFAEANVNYVKYVQGHSSYDCRPLKRTVVWGNWAEIEKPGVYNEYYI